MCSRKCAAPLVDSDSYRDPASIQTPTAAVWACGVVSVATRRPLGRVVIWKRVFVLEEVGVEFWRSRSRKKNGRRKKKVALAWRLRPLSLCALRIGSFLLPFLLPWSRARRAAHRNAWKERVRAVEDTRSLKRKEAKKKKTRWSISMMMMMASLRSLSLFFHFQLSLSLYLGLRQPLQRRRKVVRGRCGRGKPQKGGSGLRSRRREGGERANKR